MTAVAFVTEADARVAAPIAKTLGYPSVHWQQATGLCLLVAEGRKGLALAGEKPLPACCDWGDTPHRMRISRPIAKDMLAKSCLLTGRRKPTIIDATGGFGRDAWILARWGARLKLYERHPVMAWLLQDAIEAHPGLALDITGADFTHSTAKATAESCDLVYLDPLFPAARKHKAKSQKRMDLLQLLLQSTQLQPAPINQIDQINQNDQSNLTALLKAALHLARYRVVLKRPRHTPLIAPRCVGEGVAYFCLTGSSTRFDIYTKRSWSGTKRRQIA